MATSRPTAQRPSRSSSTAENKRRQAENVSSISSNRQASSTVPGVARATATGVITGLQEMLIGYIDLALTLKHIHWNVVGPNFIGVHKMLDPQVDGVQAMVDSTAERIATLGGSPNGLPGHLVATRSWDDYELERADVQSHLAALDLVYDGLISSAREKAASFEDPDLVTQDMVVGQIGELEQYQWFVRAHLEDAAGGFRHQGERTEVGAATKAARRR